MKKWILRGLVVLVVVAAAAGMAGFSYLTRGLNYGPPSDRSAWAEQPPSVSTGELAYIQRDVEGAREIWRALAEDETARLEDRAESYRLLSRTSWRIFQNTDEGVTFARAAAALDPQDWENAAALCNALSAAGNTDAALAAGRDAMARADSQNARNEAANVFARAALASVVGKRLDELTAADRERLREARDALAPAIANPPAQVDTSALALAIGIRLDDGAFAWAAWGSYYHSPTGVSAMSDQHEAAAVLSAALPRWTPTRMGAEDRRAIAMALGQSFFYDEAALLITDRRNGNADALQADAEISSLLAMAAFVRDLTAHTDEYYRGIAAANTSSNLFEVLHTFQFRQGRLALGRRLWNDLGLSGDINTDTLEAELADRFGLYYNEGSTSRVYDLHAGFRVLDTTYTANQYGRTADLRYVVVGRMISNGYESWLWDGRQQHGGWASADTIYQVRPAYADDSLRRWNQLTDPAQRREREEEIARLTAEDAGILGDARVTHLPGLAARLHWQAYNAILEYARAAGGQTNARSVFTLELDNAIRNYSIFQHEGRHSLDRLYAPEDVTSDTATLEFRAKISQVVFSDWPRLTFGSIINPNMGDNTPHGIANQRLMEGVVDWMAEHASEIEGLDPNAPLMPQFDRLTDDQIRASVRYQDPWATESS